MIDRRKAGLIALPAVGETVVREGAEKSMDITGRQPHGLHVGLMPSCNTRPNRGS